MLERQLLADTFQRRGSSNQKYFTARGTCSASFWGANDGPMMRSRISTDGELHALGASDDICGCTGPAMRGSVVLGF